MEISLKKKLLHELYEPYKKCTACPLGLLGRKNVVFGRGNPDAKLVFIGEGPGEQEDLQGKPFVGRSGQLFEKVLDALQVDTSAIFITNIVKCRPPQNRKPTPLESNTCKDLLLIKQLRIIQPTLICTLGATALEALLDKKYQITKIRGSQLSWNNIIVIPAYHPAYVLRNPPALTDFANDLEKAWELVKRKQTSSGG